MSDSDDELMDSDDLALMLKVKKSWIYAEVEANRIPAIRLGRQIRFRRVEIVEWLDASRIGPRVS